MRLVSPEERRRLEAQVGDLARLFRDGGYRFYLVGGVVRDLARGGVGDSNDIDITTDATPDVVEQLIAPWASTVWSQGARFGTIGARRRGIAIEITTHRGERYRPDSRKPDVDFSTSVLDDLSRRDFTVNAMAIELPQWELVDPYGGTDDLADGVLRTPIDPAASFTDDPLRILRAARFSAGYQLSPTPELESAMIEFADRLEIVSRERISDELRKFFILEHPGPGLALLHRTGVLSELLAVFERYDVDLALPIAAFDQAPPDAALRWGVLLWPFGASPEERSVWFTELRESSRFRREVESVLHAATVLSTTAATRTLADARRLIVAAGPDLDRGRELLRLFGAEAALDEEALVAQVLHDEGRAALRSPLRGDQVMQVLDIAGRDVGEAMAHLLECRLEEGPLDHDTAVARLESWWQRRR